MSEEFPQLSELQLDCPNIPAATLLTFAKNAPRLSALCLVSDPRSVLPALPHVTSSLVDLTLMPARNFDAELLAYRLAQCTALKSLRPSPSVKACLPTLGASVFQPHLSHLVVLRYNHSLFKWNEGQFRLLAALRRLEISKV